MFRPLLAVALAVVSAPASADDVQPITHKGQVGLSARVGIGFVGIAPYQKSTYCGQTDTSTTTGYAAVCSERAPFGIDLEASYGVATSIELVLGVTIGFEHDFGAMPGESGPRPIKLAPGARFFFSESGRSKLFVQPQIVFDFSDYKYPSGASIGTDVAAGALEGYWIDFHRAVGAYLYVGETLGIARWLSGTFEGGIGIQGRYP
jgi:opacity protein-like surface antigen